MAIVIGPCWTKFLFTKIEEEDIGNIWFQQNSTTCHTTEATLDVLRSILQDRISSRRADIIWPPRSCDLTPLYYYLWGAVKDKSYGDKPETIDALMDNIREAIGEIQLHTIDNVHKNWTDSVGYWMKLLTEKIVLSNKKRNFRKYSVVLFKQVFGGPYTFLFVFCFHSCCCCCFIVNTFIMSFICSWLGKCNCCTVASVVVDIVLHFPKNTWPTLGYQHYFYYITFKNRNFITDYTDIWLFLIN